MINKVIINGFEFSTKSDMILENTYLTGNKIDGKTTFKYPYASGEGLISSNLGSNGIYIKGILKGSDKTDLNNKIEELYAAIYGEQELDLEVYINIGLGTEEKRIGKCIINTQDIVKQENWMINIAEFEFEMLIPAGFIEDSTYTTFSALGQVSSSYTIVNVGGTFKTFGVYTFTIQSAGHTFLEILVRSIDKIRLNQTFNIGDVVVIDGETKEVRVNDILVDYSGQFPYFLPGNNRIDFLIDDLETIDIDFKYTNKYTK